MRIRAAVLILPLLLPLATRADTSPDHSCFARALSADIRAQRLDDLKLLIGWVFDNAAAHRAPQPGDVIDHNSKMARVPGFAGATKLAALAGRYRVMRAPFDLGHGYFGIEIGALAPDGKVSSLFLVNRLFRLPVIAHQPAGVATDILTNGAMFTGITTRALTDAEDAAGMALGDAERLHVPLLTGGQSQAGGEAQLQAAWMQARRPERSVATGFISLNAAPPVAAIRRLGLMPEKVEGINFMKDLDPAFGPHGLLSNHIGLAVYIHPDGTAGAAPGRQSTFAALRHPSQHLLASFNDVSLAQALASVLSASLGRCPAPT